MSEAGGEGTRPSLAEPSSSLAPDSQLLCMHEDTLDSLAWGKAVLPV